LRLADAPDDRRIEHHSGQCDARGAIPWIGTSAALTPTVVAAGESQRVAGPSGNIDSGPGCFRCRAVDFRPRRSSYCEPSDSDEEEAMKYVMLIYQGPALERQAALPEDEQKQVAADYQGINQTPGVTPGLPMGLAENATTVRVEGGNTLTTDGPFVGMKEAVGGWFILEADDLDAAIEVAARVPAARYGGAVEIRPSEVYW